MVIKLRKLLVFVSMFPFGNALFMLSLCLSFQRAETDPKILAKAKKAEEAKRKREEALKKYVCIVLLYCCS